MGERSRPTRGAWIEISRSQIKTSRKRGRAPHGARGLKSERDGLRQGDGGGRAPHGARGLKYRLYCSSCSAAESRPTRGAWIEMAHYCLDEGNIGRAPHGARGLKSRGLHSKAPYLWSRPTRGAWIEMSTDCTSPRPRARRAPHGARGLKYTSLRKYGIRLTSRPTRGAWIEIRLMYLAIAITVVAPHTGRVD